MNKWLLIWNIILTILLLSVALGGCASSDSRVDWAITQIQNLTATVAQLQSTVDYNTQLIQTQAVQIATLQSNLQSTVSQIQAYLQISGH
jgi:outer membrane murein-binding lipoprotein Lpp